MSTASWTVGTSWDSGTRRNGLVARLFSMEGRNVRLETDWPPEATGPQIAQALETLARQLREYDMPIDKNLTEKSP